MIIDKFQIYSSTKNPMNTENLENLPKWVIESGNIPQEYRISDDGILEWNRGKWKKGVWKYGIWNTYGDFEDTSVFENGIWENGIFVNGTMRNSIWKKGLVSIENYDQLCFFSEVLWYRGIVSNVDSAPAMVKFFNCHWFDGILINGIIESNSFWYHGQFIDGFFIKSLWDNGIWHNGVFSYSRWKNGLWKSGKFNNSVWENGIWKNGIFYNSKWENGTWYDGVWISGNWNSGEWKGGYIADNKKIGNYEKNWEWKEFQYDENNYVCVYSPISPKEYFENN